MILGDLSLASQVRFAKAHWEEFQDSRYGLHLMLMVRTETTAEGRDLMQRVLAMKPEPLLADKLRVSIAEAERQLAVEAEAAGDHASATSHEQKAAALAMDAAKKAQTPLGRLRAEGLQRRIRESEQER